MSLLSFLSRLVRPAAACGAAILLATAAAAAPYTMTTANGFICIAEIATGDLLYRSDVPAAMLSKQDQLLLETGIPLENQADFTRAMEDFCS